MSHPRRNESYLILLCGPLCRSSGLASYTLVPLPICTVWPLFFSLLSSRCTVYSYLPSNGRPLEMSVPCSTRSYSLPPHPPLKSRTRAIHQSMQQRPQPLPQQGPGPVRDAALSAATAAAASLGHSQRWLPSTVGHPCGLRGLKGRPALLVMECSVATDDARTSRRGTRQLTGHPAGDSKMTRKNTSSVSRCISLRTPGPVPWCCDADFQGNLLCHPIATRPRAGSGLQASRSLRRVCVSLCSKRLWRWRARLPRLV